MKAYDDLAQVRSSRQADWSAFVWIAVIFAGIALCGWLIGHYLSY